MRFCTCFAGRSAKTIALNYMLFAKPLFLLNLDVFTLTVSTALTVCVSFKLKVGTRSAGVVLPTMDCGRKCGRCLVSIHLAGRSSQLLATDNRKRLHFSSILGASSIAQQRILGQSANFDRSDVFKQNHEALVHALESQCKMQDTLAKLQDDVSKTSRLNLPAERSAVVGLAEDMWVSQQERLRMKKHDVCCRIPDADVALQTSGCLIHTPFALLLWQFLSKQEWSYDTVGVSLYELYMQFVKETGWVSPININPLKMTDRCHCALRWPKLAGLMRLTGIT